MTLVTLAYNFELLDAFISEGLKTLSETWLFGPFLPWAEWKARRLVKLLELTSMQNCITIR